MAGAFFVYMEVTFAQIRMIEKQARCLNANKPAKRIGTHPFESRGLSFIRKFDDEKESEKYYALLKVLTHLERNVLRKCINGFSVYEIAIEIRTSRAKIVRVIKSIKEKALSL